MAFLQAAPSGTTRICDFVGDHHERTLSAGATAHGRGPSVVGSSHYLGAVAPALRADVRYLDRVFGAAGKSHNVTNSRNPIATSSQPAKSFMPNYFSAMQPGRLRTLRVTIQDSTLAILQVGRVERRDHTAQVVSIEGFGNQTRARRSSLDPRGGVCAVPQTSASRCFGLEGCSRSPVRSARRGQISRPYSER